MTHHDSRPETATALQCREFVDLITAYLDDAVVGDERAEVEAHLQICDGCQSVLSQWRTVIELTGQLTEEDVRNTEPFTRDRLLSTFRALRRR
jgi:anti-sigma factor RsiW